MFGLLFVLKNERQQCQYEQSKGHQILEREIYHRHHLHSKGILAMPPCNTVALIYILSYKLNTYKQIILVYMLSFFIVAKTGAPLRDAPAAFR